MSQLSELREDLHELKELRRVAKREHSRKLLDPQIEELSKSLAKTLKENEEEKADGTEQKETQKKAYTVTLQTYSWDQSPKFTKLYVSIPDLTPAHAAQVKCDFASQGVTLNVTDLDGKNYKLVITNLAKPIIQERSHWKVKDGMVVVLLCKDRESTQWAAVTAEEAKHKSKSTAEDTADPSGNIMGLMKKMYDDGDDNMKQMLNKTWYETQMKTGGKVGGGGPEGLGLDRMPGMFDGPGGLGDI